MTVCEIEDILYRKSGLLGQSGMSADMRTLLASSDQNAKGVAEQVAVMATANGLDMLVFTGGIAEDSAEIRDTICARLKWLGLRSINTAKRSRGTRRVI